MTSLENVDSVIPLTCVQEGILAHSVSQPGNGWYIAQISIDFKGPCNQQRFEAAWTHVIEHHAALRALFLWDGLDDPLQVVRSSVQIPWNSEDWRHLCASDKDECWKIFLENDRERGFDLASAPAMRLCWLRLADEKYRMLWTFHHLISDGWSNSLILAQMFEQFHSDRPVFIEPFDWSAYVKFQRTRDTSGAMQYWRSLLADFTLPSRILDHEKRGALAVSSTAQPAAAIQPTAIDYCVDEQAKQALSQYARINRFTQNTVLLGAWSLLVGMHSRESDIVFGTTVSGRASSYENIEHAVGCCINTLPLRINLHEASVNILLQSIQEQQLQAQEYDYSSLAEVQRCSAIDAGASLFDSIVVFENYPEGAFDGFAGSGIEITGISHVEQSNYPLALLVMPGEFLKLRLVYDDSHYSYEFAHGLLNQFLHFIDELCATPLNSFVDRIPLISVDPKLQIYGNDTVASLPLGMTSIFKENLCFIKDFKQIVADKPNHPAVRCLGDGISYDELDKTSDLISRDLTMAGVVPGDFIGLHLDPGIQIIVCIVAVLKTGAAYVPLPPDYPDKHLGWVVEDALPRLIISLHSELPLEIEKHRVKLPCVSGVLRFFTDVTHNNELDIDNCSKPADNEVSYAKQAPTRPAYVIHTSGSEGRPKGVVVTMRNLMCSTMSRQSFYGDRVQRFLLTSSFAFDSSIVGIFWTLHSGGTLILPAKGIEQDMAQFSCVLHREKISHLLLLPTIYQLLLRFGDRNNLDSLEAVIVAGEPCPWHLVEQHRMAKIPARLVNEYGPTETTVWCAAAELDETLPPGIVPIGEACAHARLHLLDSSMRPVPRGICGELYISGAGLTPGYLHQASLTAERFISIPDGGGGSTLAYKSGDLAWQLANGQFVHSGRSDQQIKLRGFRIELSSIAATLEAHPSVSNAVVIARSTDQVDNSVNGRKRLLGYVVLSDKKSLLNGEELRDHLFANIPDYMVPEVIQVLDVFPALPNGKVHLRQLPDPAIRKITMLDAPVTDVERTLANIWSSLLNIGHIARQDNFFTLGGDSILSIRAVSRAREQGLSLEPGQMAAHPTLAGLASAISGDMRRGQTIATQNYADHRTGKAVALPVQQWFLNRELAVPSHWNLARLLDVDARISLEHLQSVLDCCVSHHDALRSTFAYDSNTGLWMQSIDVPVNPTLDVINIEESDLDALDRAIRIRQTEFDIGKGPLYRFAVFNTYSDKQAAPASFSSSSVAQRQLLLVFHHLVIDAVSWMILIDDLERLLTQCLQGKSLDIGMLTTPMLAFSHAIEHYRETRPFRSAKQFWKDSYLDAAVLTSSARETHVVEPFFERDSGSVETVLGVELTESLTSQANEAYGTTAIELMLCALARAHSLWMDLSKVSISFESHGRVKLNPDIDLSRTVGWFTASYPLTLSLDQDSNLAHDIRAVKEAYRQVPNLGIEFGMVRHLEPPYDVQFQEPTILFNFLGRSQDADQRLLQVIDTLEGTSRAAGNVREQQIEINAGITAGALQISWTYSTGIHNRLVIVEQAARFEQELKQIVEHCMSANNRGFSPSDFPDIGLDQEQLDEFLGDLDL